MLTHYPVRKPLIGLLALFAGIAVALPVRAQKSPPRSGGLTPRVDQEETVIGPEYSDAPETVAKEGVPKGRIISFVMKSSESKIYTGIAKNQTGVVPYERKVTVYVPAQNAPRTPSPFLVVQDGGWYVGVVSRTLDNLIAEKRVPNQVAVFIDSGGGDSLGSQRGLEYDTVSGLYAEWVEKEVLPRVEKEAGVKLTKDPSARATMGGSSGAAAAFTMAWFHPNLYRRVLSYSGTFVNQQSPLNPASPRGAWEYHASLIPNTKKKPIRVWLHVSENDNGSKLDEASLHNWVMANERMAAAFKAKGYEYRYVYARAAGHTDGRVTNHTLPGALEWVWQGYPAPVK